MICKATSSIKYMLKLSTFYSVHAIATSQEITLFSQRSLFFFLVSIPILRHKRITNYHQSGKAQVMNMIHPIVKGFANRNLLFWFTALLHIEPCNDCSVVRNHNEDHFSHTSPYSSFKLCIRISFCLWYRSHLPHSYSFHITSAAMPSSPAFMAVAGGELSHIISPVDCILWPDTNHAALFT